MTEEASRRRVRVQLRGIVQGVGFRPFVYNLARELSLGGFVLNSSAGLVAEAEGEAALVDAFLRDIVAKAPPLAWIQESAVTEITLTGAAEFEIRESTAVAGEFALVSPDVATCDACLGEIRDPANRRHGYAFTNCTNCGPRYTIIHDIPYDRPLTTMAAFTMCAACRAEYDDPRDRRFHAQPNACSECGPQLSEPMASVRGQLAAGCILAIKGLGGFQLACDARNAAAIQQLRARKKRSDKPFALMVRDMAAAESIGELSAADREALASTRRPIVIVSNRSTLPAELAPGNRTIGLMLPYTPLHHLLFDDAPYDALVMTSGNLSEEPIVVSNAEATRRLSNVADAFVLHNRDIHMRVDDSVVRTFEGSERVLRRARGYAPQVVDLPDVLGAPPPVLACGGELKNAFCLTKGRHAILSQHIGDLENYETLVFFEETLANLQKLFHVTPEAVAYDLHPLYLSTKFALGFTGLPKFGVQHHHAHIASCMAENGLEGEVIGVAFDGTGYGLDGAIWGGEFLLAGYHGFERRLHFRYVPLAGGDAAVREPRRSGLSYRLDTFGPGPQADESPRARTVRQMIEKGVNTIPTSSCGRLFDAVASLIGVRQEVTFEGQAAIELEHLTDPSEEGRYDFAFEGDTIDFRPMIERIVRKGGAAPTVAARFHNTLAAAVVEGCRRIGGKRVCLSGGSFQNMRLLGSTVQSLRTAGFEVFLHSRVPPNDGGIALGQAAVAAEKLRGGSVTD